MDLQLSDLSNPRNVGAILLTSDRFIEASDDQGFQERAGSYELWQKMDDGNLMRVQRWLKKSVVATYPKTKT